MTITGIPPDALPLFVRFVRLNPWLEPDDERMWRVFDAYVTCAQRRSDEATAALDAENHARDLQIEHDDGSWRDREAPRE